MQSPSIKKQLAGLLPPQRRHTMTRATSQTCILALCWAVVGTVERNFAPALASLWKTTMKIMAHDREPWFSFGKRNGLVVEKLEKVFEGTRTSLAKLRMGIRYAAQTLGSDLGYLRKPTGLLIGDILTVKISFSGLCEGIILISIQKCIPANENSQRAAMGRNF